MKTMYNHEVDCESNADDKVREFYFPRKQNTRENAVKRLQCEREDAFVTSMLGSLHTVLDKEEDPKETPEPSPRSTFDPNKLTSECIRTWRNERKMLSYSINDYLKQKRIGLTGDRRLRRNQLTKFRPEPSSLKLNTFFNSLHSQLNDTVMELQHVTRSSRKMKDEDILRRPSQLVKLQEADAGTDKDELRNARRDILKKLNKQQPYWMVHKNNNFEHLSDNEDKQDVGFSADEDNLESCRH